MGHRQMFICNNYRFRRDWGKVGPIENCVKNIFKKFENSKKNAENMENMEQCQMFICNDRKCILIRNLDGLRQGKNVTKSRTIGT